MPTKTLYFARKNVINEGVDCFAQNQEELLVSINVEKEFNEEMKTSY